MKKQRSFQEYRAIDLTLFAVMLALFEFVIIRTSTGMYADQLYTVSLAAAMTSIVYMRWGVWGGIHAALAGFVYCTFLNGTSDQYLIYIIGNLFSLAAVPLLRKVGYERVREGKFLSLMFPTLVWALMQIGRSAVSVVLGADPSTAIVFFATDSLSLVFTLVAIWIVRRLDGVYENQRHYLLRIHKENENRDPWE
ncbi:MAG: hypothetical protein LUE16_01775 [Lachnospiraceae bacterium]|nr:hypothetical protein [Lachnospiraceae bacterium]